MKRATSTLLTESHKTSEQSYPPSLIREDRWVIWQYKVIKGKERKIPIHPNNPGIQVSGHDRENHFSFEEAREISQREEGWGIGISIKGLPVVLIDLDNVRKPDTGEIHPSVMPLVEEADSFSDYSVSGTGIHILVEGERPDTWPKTPLPEDPDFPGATIDGIEEKCYVAMSGNQIPGSPDEIQPRQGFIDGLCEKFGHSPTSEGESESEATRDPAKEIEAPDPETIEKAKEIIQEFRADPTTTKRAKSNLAALAEGRYEAMGFEAKDGTADRSRAGFRLAGLLYGIFDGYGDQTEPPERLTKAYLKEMARENPETDDGQPRKIAQGSDYLDNTIREASRTFDRDKFLRWQRKKNSRGNRRNDYSQTTYETVFGVVRELAEDEFHTRDYPTKREILALCQLRDPDRSPRTHETALERLRDRHEEIKMACLKKGSDYRWYPAHFPDPEEALWIKPKKNEKKGEVLYG